MTNTTYKSYPPAGGVLLILFVLLAMVFPLAPQTARAAVLSRAPNNLGLVGYWAMDENSGTKANDSSGNGNTGTLSGTTIPTWASGKRAGALNFGGDDYVEAPDRPSLNPGASSLTVSMWFKMNTVGSRDSSILYNKENLFEASAGGGYFTYAWQPHWAWDGGTSFPVNVGEWYHAVVVYDKANQYVYKNGVQVYYRAQTGDMGTITNALRIGARGAPGAASSLFNGLIDDVRIYNRALSPTDVTNLYQSGSVKLKAPSNQGLVGYWSMNEGAGTKANDSSGNGYNGVFRNGATWASGKRGGAVSLDGLNDSVEVPDTANLKYAGGNMTIQAWIKPDTAEADGAFLVSKPWTWCGEYNYGLIYSSSQTIIFRLFGSTEYQMNTGSNLARRGVWSHVVATVDTDKNMKIYINGALAGSGTHDITSWNPPGCEGDKNLPLSIGTLYPYGEGWAGSTTFSFDGLLDDVRIYNRALSPTEIQNLYGSGQVTYQAPSNQGLVGYWPLNEGVGTKAGDASGNGNTGTLLNNGSDPPLSWTNGKHGKALGFPWQGWYHDVVSVPQSSSLTITTALTVCAWVTKITEPNWDRLVGNSGWSITPKNGWEFWLAGGSFGIVVYNNGNSGSINGLTNVWDGKWHHGCATFYNNSIKIYVDGVLSNSDSAGGNTTIGTNNNPILFGNNIGYDSNFGNGKLDDVRIYNRALSPTEVLQLYNSK